MYYTKADATGQIQSVQYAYDVKNNLIGLTETVGNRTQGYVYEYDDDNRIIKVTLGSTTVSYTYDDFGRLTQKVTKQGDTTVKTETYTFVDRSVETDEGEKTYTSMQVASYAVTTGGVTTTWTYTYDKNGNILTIGERENNITKTISYVYDSANQLVRENNQVEGYTHTWAYDDAGNIKFRKEYTYTTVESLANVTPSKTVSYDYNDETWGDLLTSYDNQQIEYDGIGNPEEWGNRTFTWQRGRQLASLTENGTTWTYTYDADGMRTSRTNGTTTYTYVYNGSQLVQMTVGSNTLRFTYDAAGTPLTVTYNGTTYYYVTNVQGDVVAIVDASGTKLVEYTYSSWGVVRQAEGVAEGENEALADALAELNPLRYRGYVYDAETALYYLQSRYYDPEIGRFINPDNIDLLGANGDFASLNLYAYCGNNPISRKDDGGKFWNFVVGAIVGAVIGVVTTVVEAVQEDGWEALTSGKTWAKMGISAVCGAINGTVAASGASMIVGGLVGSATGFVESLGHELIDNDGVMTEESWVTVATDTAVGFLGGLAGGNGAMYGNKYMAQQTARLANHIATDGLKKAGSFYVKMTLNYSKQFIKPTLKGLAKGWIGGKFAGDVASTLLSY